MSYLYFLSIDDVMVFHVLNRGKFEGESRREAIQGTRQGA